MDFEYAKSEQMTSARYGEGTGSHSRLGSTFDDCFLLLYNGGIQLAVETIAYRICTCWFPAALCRGSAI